MNWTRPQATVARPRSLRPLLVTAASALLLTSCTMKQLVADNMVGLLEEVEGSFLEEQNYAYGREAGASLLLMLDGVVASSPGNGGLLALAARMNAQYALGFLEEEDPEWAASLFEKALDYGLRALDDEELEASLSGDPDGVAAILADYDEGDVSLLFWTGLSYGSWINANKDSVRAVADLPNALAFMDRVIELEPGFYHGGAHLFRAKYFGSRSSEMGGDPERARTECEEAWRLSEERLLLAKVYEARFHAIPTQDLARFEELLFEVLEAPDDLLPGENMATAIAKHEAERLLFSAEEYFVDA